MRARAMRGAAGGRTNLHDEGRKHGVGVDDDGAAAGEAPHHGHGALQDQRAVQQLVHLPAARGVAVRPGRRGRSLRAPFPGPPRTPRCP
jgi:hypothetical protein